MPRPFFDFVMHHVGADALIGPLLRFCIAPLVGADAPCPPVPAAADKSKIDASLRASAHTCPASYRGVCRARVPYAPGCRGNPVDFPGVSWDACRGRCPHQPAFLNPFFSFSLRKKRTGSICQEKKEGIQNRKRIPCRHHVTTHGIGLICPPQVTPNCDPAQRSQFGKEEGASGYGAFAASAEAECSWLLLTPRRTLS